MRLVLLLLSLCAGCHPGKVGETPSIIRETETSTFKGTLLRRTYPSIPNYESMENGDKSETCWILELEHPIRARGKSMEDGASFLTEKTGTIQLVMTEEQYAEWRGKSGKRIQAKGEIFIGHNGHHHTPVLLDLSRGGKLELSGQGCE